MTLNARIIATVTPVVGVCVPDLLIQEAGESVPEEYCTFAYDLAAGMAGDDAAEEDLATVRLHYFAPHQTPTTSTRRKLRDAISAVDEFSLPTVTAATDEIGQHYVFEFDALMDAQEA